MKSFLTAASYGGSAVMVLEDFFIGVPSFAMPLAPYWLIPTPWPDPVVVKVMVSFPVEMVKLAE